MLEMNREVMDMIGELRELEHRKMVNGADAAVSDKYGYAFEPAEAFSYEPLGFAERTMRLQAEALELFGLVSTVSRFSPLFFRMSAQLERMLTRLGGCCVTKAVLEQQAGESFRLLNDLTIDSLRRMAAFNFRKCYSSFMESRAEGRYKPEAFGLSVRWASLDRRLEATGERIEAIRAGKVRIDLSEKEPSAEPRKETAAERAARPEPSTFAPKAAALPVDMAAVRSAAKAAAREDAETPAAETPEAATPEAEPVPMLPAPEAGSAGAENEEALDPDEKFMQDVLLSDALGRGDREAYETAAAARGEQIADLWERFMERESHSGFAHLRRIGLMMGTDPPPGEEPEFAEAVELAAG